MKVPRLTVTSPGQRLERACRQSAVSLAVCAVTLAAALAGCQTQQTNPNDPFLPFMRTRVPPPGTTVPADQYYQGAPGTSAPPAVSAPPVYTPPPPAGAPMTAPSTMPTNPGDKYSPPGGYNLPQSSIDRSKVTAPGSGEVKAGGTAIARRSLAKPGGGPATVDTQLTADRVSGATAGAAIAGVGETTSTATTVAKLSIGGDRAPDAAVEMEEKPSAGAALAFADAPATASGAAAAVQSTPQRPAEKMQVASTRQWPAENAPAGSSAPGTSTLRIVGADEQDALAMADGGGAPDEHDVAAETGGQDPAVGNETTGDRAEYVHDTTDLAGPLWVKEHEAAQASPIETTEPAGQATTLAMADASSQVVQAGWNEPATAAAGTKPSRPAARGNQPYGYDPAYGWLRGRLEYSASQRQWKLRYIPIDGATDQFGGSVVLADGPVTQNLHVGDFVTAQGRVVGATQPGRGFSPRFEVAAIQATGGVN